MNKDGYYISVSDPWDFVGPDGKNILKGVLMKIISKDCVIFKSNSLIEIDKVKGDIFVLLSRHQGNHFNKIADKGFWTIGVGLLLTNSYEGMDKDQLEQNSKYVIIGTLRKYQNDS